MNIVGRASASSSQAKSDDIPKRLLEPFARMLRTGVPQATIDRLFVSEHVADLRLIVAFALVGVALVGVIGVGVSLADGSIHGRVFSDLGSFATFYTPALGIFGAVLAWAYQAGSARLGIVDLFACEIDTLCRVALVADSVTRSIQIFQLGLPERNGTGHSAPPIHFTSEENYFPVFENNTRDLQALEARVVVNITAFYTYMKAVRDSTRALMDLSASPAQQAPHADKAPALSPSQEAARNVIYMLFLGLESARKAMKCLVEFEPEQAERLMIILLSELEAYHFLRDQFVDEDDVRQRRLELREAEYKRIVPSLCSCVETCRAATPSDWEPAWRLVPELKRKYETVMRQSFQPHCLASTA